MKRLYLLIVLFFSLFSGYAAEVEFKVNAPATVEVKQPFEVVFTVNAQPSGFTPPTFKGFSILSGPNQSMRSSFQSYNGQTVQSLNISYSYYLQADMPGTFTIPAASVTVNGKTYQSQSVQVKAVKGSGQTPAATNAPQGRQQQQSVVSIDDNTIFIRANASKTTALQGEQIIISYKIYTAVNISNYTPPKITSGNGFWTEDLLDENQQTETKTEVVNGRKYWTKEIRKIAVFPQDIGKLTLAPLEMTVLANVETPRRSTGSVWDMFDDAFFNQTQSVEKKIRSNAIAINVSPLPQAGRPDNFSGAVGKFNFTGKADKTNTKTGEAVTLKYTISGSGNLKSMNDLQVQFPSDFEVFDPKINDHTQKSLAGVAGNKTIEYVIIPRSVGDFTVPPVEFSYFDIQSQKYVTLTAEAVKLHVEKGTNEGGSVVSGSNKEDIKYLNKDISYIKTADFKLRLNNQIFFGSKLFFILLVLPLLIFLIVFFVWRKRMKLLEDVSLLKTKKANKAALSRLKKARHYLSIKDENNFYIEISQALWGYLRDKFNMPLAELSMDNVKEVLTQKNVDSETIDYLINTLHHCEFSRFAPGDKSEKMDQLYHEMLQAITMVEKGLK